MDINKEAAVHIVSNLINAETCIHSSDIDYGGSIYDIVGTASLLQKLEGCFGELLQIAPEYYLDDHRNRFSRMRESLVEISSNESNELIQAKLIIDILLKISLFDKLSILPSVDSEGRFSYSRKVDDTDNSRTNTTFGRIVRRQLMVPSTSIKDDVLTKLAELMVQRVWVSSDDVQELTGRDIVDAYEHYHGLSCMNGDRSKYMEVCAKNPDKVKLLVNTNESGNYIAKALLWKTDQGKWFLDRVYNHDRYYSKGLSLVGYARNLGADIAENPFSGRRNSGFTVTLDFSKCDFVPYFDSFVRVEKQNEDLTEVVLSTEGFVELQSAKGKGLYECVKCGGKHVGDLCPRCESDYILHGNSGEIECSHCGSDNITGRVMQYGEILYVCEECIDDRYHNCSCCARLVRDGMDCQFC